MPTEEEAVGTCFPGIGGRKKETGGKKTPPIRPRELWSRENTWPKQRKGLKFRIAFLKQASFPANSGIGSQPGSWRLDLFKQLFLADSKHRSWSFALGRIKQGSVSPVRSWLLIILYRLQHWEKEFREREKWGKKRNKKGLLTNIQTGDSNDPFHNEWMWKPETFFKVGKNN